MYKKRLSLPFEVMGSPRNLSREKIEPLAAAGLWRVNMGVESGSERTKREVYNRVITNEEVIKASRVMSDFRSVVLNCFLIISNPYEENSDLLETIGLVKNMSAPFSLTIYNLIFFPGIPLYRKAVEDNIISGKADSGYEMNFLAGLQYKGHAWKNKNLYLNGLIYMMMGRTTKFRFGLIPRIALGVLLDRRVIAFNDNFPYLAQTMIFLKRKLWRVRAWVIAVIKKNLKNPTIVRK
jgi:radical SAM superfamily enzyme YgiQ (UPF0313 family)